MCSPLDDNSLVELSLRGEESSDPWIRRQQGNGWMGWSALCFRVEHNDRRRERAHPSRWHQR